MKVQHTSATTAICCSGLHMIAESHLLLLDIEVALLEVRQLKPDFLHHTAPWVFVDTIPGELLGLAAFTNQR